MPRQTLDDILADDDGLLDVKLPTSQPTSEEQRVQSSFEEINAFIDHHGRKPGDTDSLTVQERHLSIKLAGLLDNPVHHEFLRQFDRHNLLPAPEAEPQSLEEILDSDDELLDTGHEDIFNMVHVSASPAKTDHVSERQVCDDFEQYKPLFDQCLKEVKEGRRRTIPFSNEQEIDAGEFFILNGVMVYVAEMGEVHIRNGKRNARLRLIFDNGTKGNNLLRSLATELYKDENGRRVTSPDAGPLFDSQIEDSDIQTGMVYVVKSLSSDPEVKQYDGLLHKIGFTSGKMETRIQNAEDDPTFLMAPVHPVATYTLYNIDRVKLEHLLHTFFAKARLDIEITDRFGKKVKPREWFLVPPDIISEAIARLKDGSIINYEYDPDTGRIVGRESASSIKP